MNTDTYKQQLEKELGLVENELKTVGRINPVNPKDWEPTPPPQDTDLAENEEVAERIEAYEGNTAILKELEIRFNEIKTALKKIEEGKYGNCEVCGKPIEEDRLQANPAARTCKEHMN
jgi:RNA polymerase-binding transcription factor DksA